MADEVNITVDQVTEEVTINVTNGGGLGTVTSVAIQGTDGIQVDSGSPIITNGIIVLGLSPTVLSQLSLAASSIQPGDNISELVNNAGFLEGIQAGSNISIDNTDPLNPVISATGMGTGTVTSVGISGTDGIEVDSGSPVTTSGNIQLGLSSTVLGQLSLASSALQPGANISELANDSGYIDSSYLSSWSGSSNLTTLGTVTTGTWSATTIALNRGGTGATTAPNARTNLGLGSLATANTINNGNWSGTDLAIANGGTGASDANTARTNLGLSIGGDVQPYSAGTVVVASPPTDPGFIPYFDGTQWDVISSIQDANISSAATWNAKIGGSTGSTDNVILVADGTGGKTAKVAGSVALLNGARIGTGPDVNSVVFGIGALANISSGTGILALGGLAAAATTTGYNIVALGFGAASANVGGAFITAIGAGAAANSTDNFITAIGSGALGSVTTGYINTAIGHNAGNFDGSGSPANPNTSLYIGHDVRSGSTAASNEIAIAPISGQGLGNNSTVIGSSGTTRARIWGNLESINTSGGSYFRALGSYSSATSLEGTQMGHDGSVGYIGTVAGSGGGTVRDLTIVRGGTTHLTLSSTLLTANMPLAMQKTITPGGTTGAQSINTQTGTVNFAAGATSLVVTSSLVTTSSIILPVLRTNDASALIDSIVPASGSFTIYLSSAATAETSVGFVVL